MNLISFLRNPVYFGRDNRPSQLLITVCWYFGCTVAVSLLFLGFGRVFPEGVPEVTRRYPDLPLWLVLLLPPLIEELAFRFPLRRSLATLGVGLFFLAFLLVSKGFGGEIYTAKLLPARIGIAFGLAGVVWLVARERLLRMPFVRFFYLSALLFGSMHLFNYMPFSFPRTAVVVLYLTLYVLTKSLSASILGYARIKHGFGFVVLLHVLHNLPVIVLYKF